MQFQMKMTPDSRVFVAGSTHEGEETIVLTVYRALLQEWADFRCEQLTRYYSEMERYIRELNPETAVESNPHSGISGRNTVWEQGVDYPRFLRHMDVVWTEEGNEPGVTSDGIKYPGTVMDGAAQNSGSTADSVFLIPDVVTKSCLKEFSVWSTL